MSNESEQDYVLEIVQELVLANYVNVALLTVLVYDVGLTFSKEVKYFWTKPKSAAAVLFLSYRYLSVIAATMPLFADAMEANVAICRLEYFSAPLSAVLLNYMDYILFLRVRALYSKGRILTNILLVILGLEAVALVTLVVYSVVLEHPEFAQIEPGLSACPQNDGPLVASLISWLIPAAYGALLMILALYKASVLWRESAGIKGIPLVAVLIRDQALYFFVVIFVSFANVFGTVLDLSVIPDTVLGAAGSTTVLSVVGARLLINMKEAGEKGLNQGTSCPSKQTVRSGMVFAEPSVRDAAEGATDSAMEYGQGGIEEVA